MWYCAIVCDKVDTTFIKLTCNIQNTFGINISMPFIKNYLKNYSILLRIFKLFLKTEIRIKHWMNEKNMPINFMIC